jgi:preprotein translocase subunit SecE
MRPGNGLPRRTYPQKWIGGRFRPFIRLGGASLFEDTKFMTSPFKFLQEVRAEADKVTWPTRRETLITTIMVFVMVALSSILFLVADQIIRIVITFILGIAG